MSGGVRSSNKGKDVLKILFSYEEYYEKDLKKFHS